jgi:hypothetical protein
MDSGPRLVETKCPHCGGQLLVDRDSGEVQRHTNPKSKAGRKLFDQAIEQVQSREKGMGQTFESAFSAVKDRGKDFDAKFDKALKGVDPNAPPPPNIFDLEDGKVAPRSLPDDEDEDDDGEDDDDSN